MRRRQRAALQQLEDWVLQRDAYAEEVGLMPLLSCPLTGELCTYFFDGILVKHVTLPLANWRTQRIAMLLMQAREAGAVPVLTGLLKRTGKRQCLTRRCPAPHAYGIAGHD